MKIIFCTLTFIITASNLKSQIPILDLGSDSSYCTNNSIVITSNIIDSFYTYIWSTGDSTFTIEVTTSGIYWLQIEYDSIVYDSTTMMFIDSLITLSDTINIIINNEPIPSFEVVNNCYGIASFILNNSIFSQGSIISYIVNSDTIITEADTVVYNNLQNGQISGVMVNIDQPNGCMVNDTFEIESILKPTLILTLDSTCENLNPVVTNESVNTTNFYQILMTEEITLEYSESQDLILPIQSPGIHIFQSVIINSNGCSDSMVLPLYIYEVLPREIIGLENDYCVNDFADTISGNFAGGIFTGQYIENISEGVALFNPFMIDSNVLVTYTYTDSNNCTASSTNIVENVYPLPSLSIEGLDAQYCQFDDPDIIIYDPEDASIVGEGLSNIILGEAVFTPNIVGINTLQMDYIDNNGCYNFLVKSAIVNPLPNIDLGPSDTLIQSGQSILIGPEINDPDISFLWSTGQTTNQIEINNPGYYILNGVNNTTHCESSDTIRVELINKSDYAVPDINYSIYPLPFETKLIIEGQNIKEVEVMNILGQKIDFKYSKSDKLVELHIVPGHGILFIKINRFLVVPILQL